ncbi:MAG: putative lipoprotein [Gammaproteobacteria bacterium]|nr:putative lipoprotein [Gammaproteobacteria bacterium]
MRFTVPILVFVSSGLLTACVGGSGSATNATPPPPTVNTMAIVVDGGPAAASGQINHAYVTVKVCAPGSSTQCANIDHVLLDTGSNGLRLVRSVLDAATLALGTETDAQGQTIEECVAFGGGKTWGPVALADVTLAAEVAAKVPVQILDDTGAGASPPATCGANGTLINSVSAIGANGLLGVGVFAQDCGPACVNAATPLAIYYGCTGAGVCTAENVSLPQQVTNPVALFASDNNGIVVTFPNLANANGDASAQGQLTFGIATQTDNALPAAGLTVLAADASGDFRASYNGAATLLPALIDSGTGSYAFDASNDPNIVACTGVPPQSPAWVGYYCPLVAPESAFAVNSPPPGVNGPSNTVNFAVADPNSFVANAAAFVNLAGGGGSSTIIWGMPFFYGRTIYFGIDKLAAGSYTGPFYAY